MIVVCLVVVLSYGIETWAVVASVSNIHPYCLDAWEHIAQICDDVFDLLFLGRGASVGWVTALVEATFVADADAVVVMTFAVVTGFCKQNVLGYCSVLSDIEVIRYVLMAFVYGTDPKLLCVDVFVWV